MSGKIAQVQESKRKLTDTEKWMLDVVAPSYAKLLLHDERFNERFIQSVEQHLEVLKKQ